MKNLTTRVLRILFPALLSVLLAGCGGGGNNSGTPLLGGTTSSTGTTSSGGTTTVASSTYDLVVSAPSSAVAGGTTTPITATLTQGGKPVVGQTLTFVLGSNLSGGTLAQTTATTDQSGVAAINYTAGPSSGTDRIVVTASPSTTSTSAGSTTVVGSIAVQVTATTGAVGAYAIVVSAASQSVAGGATTAITATLTNNGTPVNNQGVTFALGSNLSGAKLSSPTATTNASGQAAVNYTAGSLSGSDSIVVSAAIPNGSGTTTVAGSVTIVVTAAASVGTQYRISLSAVGGASMATGVSTELIATVTDSSGNVIANKPVTFTFSTSVTGGELTSGSTTGPTETATTATGTGQAGVLYTAGSTTGTDIVTASVTDPSNNAVTASISLNVVSGNTTNIALSLTPLNTVATHNTACAGVQTVTNYVPMIATVLNAGTSTPATGVTVTFTMGSVTSSGYLPDLCSTSTPPPEVLVSGGIKNSAAQVVQSLSASSTDASGNVYADYIAGGMYGPSVNDTVIVTVSRGGVVLGSKSMLVNVNN